MKYSVAMSAVKKCYKTVVVEAEDYDDAVNRAYENINSGWSVASFVSDVDVIFVQEEE